MTKSTMRNKCTSFAGHFNGRGSEPVQYKVHYLMQHVQGYSGSHWTPPLGNYSLCIALAAAGATETKQQKTCINFAGHLDGRGSVPEAV
jgi:hypothetical protein